MTRQEFDVWIEAHYPELVAVATRRGAREPRDVVHTAIVQMLTNGGYTKTEKPWSWAVLYVRGASRDAREKERNLADAQNDLSIISHASTPSLGWKKPTPRAD